MCVVMGETERAEGKGGTVRWVGTTENLGCSLCVHQGIPARPFGLARAAVCPGGVGECG